MIKKVIAASAATGGLLLAGAGTTVADTGAKGGTVGSSGLGSGNLLQVPLNLPLNVCGNTIDVIGLLNPVFGNDCANGESGNLRHHHKPQAKHEPQERHHAPSHHRAATPIVAHSHHQAAVHPQLAATGSERVNLAIPAGASAGLILGGVLLYRRGRRASARV
ncbi:TRAP transporter small membrane protein [Streptomyces sp. NBRC 110611]|nr:TRAP transporter small membrane protein [Streptomyces sp. NBRC 110611]